MSRTASHLAVAAVALVAGGATSAALFAHADPVRTAATVSAPPAPEQVRTEVVTRTIHRVRHVHPRHHRAAVAAAPPMPSSAPPVPVVTPVVRTAAPVAAVRRTTAPVRPLQTRSSGAAGTREHEDSHESEHEHEGGGDD